MRFSSVFRALGRVVDRLLNAAVQPVEGVVGHGRVVAGAGRVVAGERLKHPAHLVPAFDPQNRTVNATARAMPHDTSFSRTASHNPILPIPSIHANICACPLCLAHRQLPLVFGGGLNARGIYYYTTSGQDRTIRNIRLHGTLVIDASGKKVVIDQTCFMQPLRPDLPVLIVKGDVDFSFESAGTSQYLSESAQGHNYNPAGAPYLNSTDSDLADNYPSEIRGLIQVIGNVRFRKPGVFRGALLVQGTVTVEDDPQIYHDRNLILNPPWGYSSAPNGTSMIVQAQSWTRQPAP
jgi:hypothetical protein